MKFITTVIVLLLAVFNVNAQESMKENVDFNVWPKGELNSAYAKYFIPNWSLEIYSIPFSNDRH